jgi:hypothetical protein
MVLTWVRLHGSDCMLLTWACLHSPYSLRPAKAVLLIGAVE